LHPSSQRRFTGIEPSALPKPQRVIPKVWEIAASGRVSDVTLANLVTELIGTGGALHPAEAAA
jgi:ABC-type nitrate/sulfonate/bicarbonate transport system permease component